MKTKAILVALTIIAALSMVSCKNNKKTNEYSQEDVQEMKHELADSVLAEIDALAELLFDAQSKSFKLKSLKLSDSEKMVKPDYLLDLSVANTLVTKSQKINALAIYIIDLSVRMIYDMPCDEANETIAKLATEVSFPINLDFLNSDVPASDKVVKTYEICRERGDLAYFWQFQYAILTEISYILIQNPELFFSKFTDDQLEAYGVRGHKIYDAIDVLAKYDEEIEMLREMRDKHRIMPSMNKWQNIYQSRESHIQTRIAKRDLYIARRNDLLQ